MPQNRRLVAATAAAVALTGTALAQSSQVTLALEQQAEAQQQRAGTYQPQPDAPNAIASRVHVDYDIVHNDTIEIADRTASIRTLVNSGDTASPTTALPGRGTSLALQPPAT